MREDAAKIILSTEVATTPLSSCVGATADGEMERVRAKEARLSAGAEMLKATFNNVRQGFLLLDDQLQVRSFNPRINELIGFPPGVIYEGATAFSLISASVALGHYPGSSVEAAYAAWTSGSRIARPVTIAVARRTVERPRSVVCRSARASG